MVISLPVFVDWFVRNSSFYRARLWPAESREALPVARLIYFKAYHRKAVINLSDKVTFGKGTIYEHGYGLIAKKVMRDRNLSIKAKAVYAYLCSYAGNGTTAFPSVEHVLYDLDITRDSFYKYMKELKKQGYVTAEKQRQAGNKFANNIYNIELLPCPKISDTEKPTTEKLDTNSNNLTSNNFTNNNSYKGNVKDIPIAWTELDLTESEYEIISYYMRTYEQYLQREHPRLKPEQWESVRESLFYCGDGEYSKEFDLDETALIDMIDQHFRTRYANCDYNILHFCSPGVKVRRMYEVAY